MGANDARSRSDEGVGVIASAEAEYQPRDPAATSYLMSRVRGTGTRMETKLRSRLHRAGYRFRKNVGSLIGKPDVVFSRERVVVFVDGDYWHARVLKEVGLDALRRSLKTKNRDFWISKLRRNYERDLAVTAGLEGDGWLVVRIWESDLKRDMDGQLRLITDAVQHRRVRATNGGASIE